MSSGGIGTKGVPRPEREEQIVQAGIAEFGARGYARSSVLSVAARAGISKPLVYQYFGSKEGLYLACLHHVAGGLLSRLQDAEQEVDDTVASRIHPLRAVFTALEPQREAWRMLFDATMPSTGPIADEAADYQQRAAAIAAAGSERFLAARGIHSELDTSALTHLWMGVVDSLVGWWLEHPDDSAQDMIDRCARLFFALLS